MARTASGAISMANVNVALGLTSTAQISFNDAKVRFLANNDSGSVNINALRNKYYFTGTVTARDFMDEFGGPYTIGHPVTNGVGVPSSITGTVFENVSPSMSDIYYFDVTTRLAVNPGTNPPNVNMRLKIGNNNAVTLTQAAYSGYYEFQASGGTNVVFNSSNDVGVTRTWQFAQA